MNNIVHIVVIVLVIQAVALLIAMAFGRAAKAGDRLQCIEDIPAHGKTSADGSRPNDAAAARRTSHRLG
jgi:hypothetical protein